MPHIVGVDLSVGHAPESLILPNVSERLSTKGRGFHDLEIDASDLGRRIGRNERCDESGSDKRHSMGDSHPCLLSGIQEPPIRWQIVAAWHRTIKRPTIQGTATEALRHRRVEPWA